ncbi:ORF156 [Leucania separata nucleopolyhedrovirus]|uniref:ORF156 n=1 Tax=Leucania separata nucleopolyhedrovirus TaxID=1307956 RepID=Q0IKW3_NPVLS|nr:ORF156 [Leucania separata nucleopolyhedrovirus]AAR28920.1 ORF156 [Leucania separata nucleopolyhedrovirus]
MILQIPNIMDILHTPEEKRPIGPCILELYEFPFRYTCTEFGKQYKLRFEFYDFDIDLTDVPEGRMPLVPEQFKVTMPVSRELFLLYDGYRCRQDIENKLLIVEFLTTADLRDNAKTMVVHYNSSYYIRNKAEWMPNLYKLNECHASFLDKIYYRKSTLSFVEFENLCKQGFGQEQSDEEMEEEEDTDGDYSEYSEYDDDHYDAPKDPDEGYEEIDVRTKKVVKKLPAKPAPPVAQPSAPIFIFGSK